MKVIGLCGGSGSGKGTVAKIFCKYNIPSIDTDAIYHKITSKSSPCLTALSDRFGSNILNSDGSLNRSALSKMVFWGDNAKKNRDDLNRITHHFVRVETEKQLLAFKNDGYNFVLVDVPLMFESGFDKMCDIIIAVVADYETRVCRIMKRDLISKESAISRINSQLSDEYLIKHSDYTIVNNGTQEELALAVASVAEKIL